MLLASWPDVVRVSFCWLDSDLSQSSDTLWSEQTHTWGTGTHLTETRSDGPGFFLVFERPPESHFPLWSAHDKKKVGDGLILTAAEIINQHRLAFDMKWTRPSAHGDRVPDTSQPPVVSPLFHWRCCCNFNVIWSGDAVLESCLERRADRKAAWPSWRLLSGTPSRLLTWKPYWWVWWSPSGLWCRYKDPDAQLVKRTMRADHHW